MVNYRRSRIAGGTFFFTANLLDWRETLLVDHIDRLRRIFIKVRTKLPFVIDAMVVLPDHWHTVWTMPPRDCDYAGRLRLIKARFTKQLLREGIIISQDDRGEYKLWHSTLFAFRV